MTAAQNPAIACCSRHDLQQHPGHQAGRTRGRDGPRDRATSARSGRAPGSVDSAHRKWRPATTVRSDLLQSLLDELAGLGHRYSAVAILPGLDAQAPSVLGFDVRITNQDAILVRTDLSDEIEVSNLQIEQFGMKLALPTSVGPITDPRGWAAIDVNARGSSFRFVTTHLDFVSPRSASRRPASCSGPPPTPPFRWSWLAISISRPIPRSIRRSRRIRR